MRPKLCQRCLVQRLPDSAHLIVGHGASDWSLCVDLNPREYIRWWGARSRNGRDSGEGCRPYAAYL
jgi:hypothetical protein